MGTAKLINLLSTYVDQFNPTQNYDAGASVYVKNITGRGSYAYIYFTRPFPLGATITSAKLHLYAYNKPIGNPITLYLRLLNQQITYGKVTWNSRATNLITTIPERTSVQPGSYPDRTDFVFDITSHMQAISDGTKWYGYQVRTDWTDPNFSPRFMSPQHPNPGIRPWIEITWSDKPDAPSQLSPAGGRVISTQQPILRFDYTDVSGDTDLAQCRVQISTTTSFTSPVYDSMDQAVDTPQWDLTGSAFTATQGTTYYWRVMVQDGAGLWSGWSAPVAFVYKPLPTVEIQNPPLPPNNFVEEPTPPITWNVTSGSQASYSIDIYREVDDRWVSVFHRGRTVSSTTDGMGVPSGVITIKDATYLVDIRVWDAENREAVPNGQVYRLRSREFTYEYSAATSPVTNLTATPSDPRPGIMIEWDRATAPDSYSITRNGVIIASGLDPDNDTYVDGIHNRWFDRTPVKGRANTYTVQAVVNGKASTGNPTVTKTNQFPGTWLLDGDGSRKVAIFNDQQRTMQFGEQSATYEPLGAEAVAVVTQGMRGYQGQITGEITGGLDHIGLTESISTWYNNMLNLKSYAGQMIFLFTDDMTIPIVMQNVNVVHMPGEDGERYAVSFDFFQIGDLTYTPRLGF